MFHILSIEGPVFDVPLEKLQQREELKRIARAHPPRKIVADQAAEQPESKPGNRELSYAQKSYRQDIKLDDERLELLHAFQIMSSPVISLSPEMTVADGWRYFYKNNVRHMPVLSQDEQIIGIVSERDLLNRLMILNQAVERSTNQTIAEVMARQVISASRETDIRRIARAMFESHIGTMPIVDDRKHLIGIITRSDILFALIHYGAMKMWA